MKKWAYYLLAVLALVVITQSTAFSVYDAPHNETNNIFCGDCHGQALDIRDSEDNPIVSPFWDGTSSADAVYNALCLRCHNGSDAPLANTHAPGTTLIKCTICHHNHEQDQVYPGKYNKNNFFIARGTALSAVESGGVTTISYTVPTGLWATNPGSDWAADLANLAAKTEAGRGAMLVPTIAWSQSRWPVFEIESINTTTGEITVKGDASTTATELKARAADFGIFYGQQIRSIITYEGNLKYVQFYDNKGNYSFVNQASSTGICQICHSDTNHFQSTLGAAPGGDNHNPDSNCSLCHKHNDINNGAFFPSADHVDDGLVIYPAPATDNCDLCHNGDEISGLDTHGSDCQLCHVPSDNNRMRTIAEIEADGARAGRVTTPPSSPAGFLNGGTLGGTDGGGTCSECHSTYLSNWYFHEVDHTLMGWVTPNTDTSSNTVNCTGCHDASSILTGVHNLGASGTAKDTCDNCHNPAIDTKDLIGSALNGNSNGPLPPHEDHTVDPVNECASCHTAHFDAHDHGDDLGGADTIFHDITFTPAVDHNVDNTLCNACHTGNNADGNGTALDSWADIYSEHNSSCVLCHDYTDADSNGTPPLADVFANIPGSGVTCVSCHTPKDGPAFHGGHDATHFGFDAACVGCHNAILHGGGTEVVANVHANDCTICHSGSPQTRDNEKEGDAANGIDGDARLANGAASNATPFDSSVYTCTTCHPGAVPDDLTFATIHHDSKNDLAVNDNCSDCHIGAPAGNHTATVSLAGNCADCHTGTQGVVNGISVTAANNKRHDACIACHYIDTGDNYYAKLIDPASTPLVTVMDNGGSVGGTDGGGDCEDCHTGGFDGYHLTSVSHDPMVNQYANCAVCHAGTEAPAGAFVMYPADAKKHDACLSCHQADGRLTSSAAGNDGATLGGTDGGGTCFTCHGEFFPSHTNIDHQTTVDLNNNCADCHTGTEGTATTVPLNAGDDKVHDTCSGCHENDGDLTGSAAGNDGGTQHGTDAVNNCETCHDTFYTNHTLTVSHDPMVNQYGNCAVCHAGTEAPAGAYVMYPSDAKKHDACSTCHEADGSLTGSASGNNGGVNGGTDGGGTCFTCHTEYFSNHTNIDHSTSVALDINTASKNECVDCHTGTQGSTTTVPTDSGATKAANKKHDDCFACHQVDGVLTGLAAPNDGGTANGTDGGGNCQTCHGAYFDSHTHGIAGNHVVSYSAAVDISQTGGADNECADCHDDNSGSLASWTDIYVEHGSSCSTCHDYGAVTTDTPPVATNDSLIANNTTATCVTCHAPKSFAGSPATSEHGGHPLDFSATANCTPCHTVPAAGVLKGIHGNGTSATCSLCHNGSPTRDNERLGVNGDGDARLADGIAAADPGDGSAWAAIDCEDCHNQTEVAGFHGITTTEVTSSHQLSSDSSGGYDCEACHSTNVANEQLTTHLPADTVANCAAICHTNTTNPATTGASAQAKAVIDTAVAASAAVNCEQCHAAKGDYKRHGLVDDGGADGAVDVHNNLSVSTNVGSGTETDCAACHSLTSVLIRLQMHTQPLSGDTNDCLTCHTATGAAVTAINNGKGAGSAQTCENCHTAKGIYTRHGLTSALGADTVADVHEYFQASTGTDETDCAECHIAGTVTQRIDLHANCLTCHNEATTPATTVIQNGWSVPTTANCESCHDRKGQYLMHGLDDDDTVGGASAGDYGGIGDGTGGVVFHDNIGNSLGVAPNFTGKLAPGTYNGLLATEYNCGQCHSANADSLDGSNNPNISDLEAMQLHTLSGGGSGTCLTCHAPANELVDEMSAGFDSTGSPVTINCETCHSTGTTTGDTGPSGEAMYQYDGVRHHKTGHAQAGDCTWCHADPRLAVPTMASGFAPTASANASDNGVGTSVTGYITDFSTATPSPVPKQPACRLCHTNYGTDGAGTAHTVNSLGGNGNHGYNMATYSGTATERTTGLTVYANDFNAGASGAGDNTTATVNATRVTQSVTHRIDANNGTDMINVYDYGACFGCHSIQVMHAAPVPGQDYPNVAGITTIPWDTLRYAPGRGVFNELRGANNNTQAWNQHRLTEENGIQDLFGQGTADPRGRDYIRDNNNGTDWHFGGAVTHNTVTVPLGAVYDNWDTQTGAYVVYFGDIAVPSVPDNVRFISASWDGATVTVEALNDDGCAELSVRTRPDGVLRVSAGNFVDAVPCSATFALGSISGVTLDIETTNAAGTFDTGNAITDNSCQPGEFTFTSATYAVGESDGTVTIWVNRSNGDCGAVDVDYATANGTATQPGDYTSASDTLSWTDGDAVAKSFNVTIIDDGVNDGDQDFTVSLSGATGLATVGTPGTTTVTIQEDDQPGSFRFSSGTYTVAENGTTATIAVQRYAGKQGAVSVRCDTSNGTATAGTDYTATTDTLNWADQDTADKNCTVPITDDGIWQGDLTVNLALTNNSAGTILGSPNTAVLTIQDDETPPDNVVSGWANWTPGASLTVPVALNGAWDMLADTNGGGSSTNSYSAPAGTNRILIVVVTHEDGATETVSSVTYNGSAVNMITEQGDVAGTDNTYIWIGYQLLGTGGAIGATNVQANFSGTVDVSAIAVATYDNANQLAAPVNSNEDAGNNNRSISVTNAEYGKVIYGVSFNNANGITPPGGWTERVDATVSDGAWAPVEYRMGVGDRDSTAAGSVTVNPTGSASDETLLVGVSIDAHDLGSTSATLDVKAANTNGTSGGNTMNAAYNGQNFAMTNIGGNQWTLVGATDALDTYVNSMTITTTQDATGITIPVDNDVGVPSWPTIAVTFAEWDGVSDVDVYATSTWNDQDQLWVDYDGSGATAMTWNVAQTRWEHAFTGYGAFVADNATVTSEAASNSPQVLAVVDSTAGDSLSAMSVTWGETGEGYTLVITGTSSDGNVGNTWTVVYYNNATGEGSGTTYNETTHFAYPSWVGSNFTIRIGTQGTPVNPVSIFRDRIHVTNDNGGDATVTHSPNCNVAAAGTYVEAENYSSGTPGTGTWNWSAQTGEGSANGYMNTDTGGTGAATNGGQANYDNLDFSSSAGTYNFWMRARNPVAGNSTFVGANGTCQVGLTQGNAAYVWESSQQATTCNNTNTYTFSAAKHSLTMWPREQDQRTDGLFISTGTPLTNNNTVPDPMTAAFTYKIIDPRVCP